MVLQGSQHGGEIHAMGGLVVVGVVVDFEAGAFEQRTVVFPARVADVNLGIRGEALQEVGADFQRAGAAQCLHGHGTFLLNYGAVGTKYQLLHRLVVSCQAFDWQVGTRGVLFDQDRFRLFHALQQRHFAIVVIIDTYAQVDFRWVSVCIKGFGDAEDRVARGHLDGAENGRVRHD